MINRSLSRLLKAGILPLSALTLTPLCLAGDLPPSAFIGPLGLSNKPIHRDTWLNFGGLSWHSNPPDVKKLRMKQAEYQEVNQGLGYDMPVTESTRLGVGGYRNSLNRSSNYIMLMSTFKSWVPFSNSRIKAGVMYGAISGYREGYVPVVSPAVTMQYKSVGVMFTYLPETDITNTAVLAMQIRLKVI